MKILVTVIVYDRFDNLKEWIRCYKMCNTQNSELVIIHNYKNDVEREICQNICQKEEIKCVSRENIGMDIGAFQDVCMERLFGFPNQWDYLLWATDDVIPMCKNFIQTYLDTVKTPNVGVVCLEVSPESGLHIRTSGFVVSKAISLKLKFPCDPISTKDDCYNFEHRGDETFFKQIIKIGMSVKQMSDTLITGHLWDTGHRVSLNRWEQHYAEFPK